MRDLVTAPDPQRDVRGAAGDGLGEAGQGPDVAVTGPDQQVAAAQAGCPGGAARLDGAVANG